MALNKGNLEIALNNIALIKGLKKPIIIGIDASLNSTGIIILDFNGKLLNEYNIVSKIFGVNRLSQNNKKFLLILEEYKKQNMFAIKEGYSYNMRDTNNAVNMGEWGGIIKLNLHTYNIPLLEVAPQSLKKFIGVTDKSMIIKEMFKVFGYDAKNDDMADAYALATIGVKLRKILIGKKISLNKKQEEVIKMLLNPKSKTRKSRENHI